LFGWKPLVALGGLTAAVVILGVILLQQRTGHQSDLAVVAEERHHEYANQKVAPEFTGKVPDAVAQKLGNRLDMSAFAYSVADADFSTQGARVCDIAGVPAAWILGSYKGTPVSMIVFKENEIGAFAEVQKRFRSGESLVDCGNGHCEIVVRILNGHVVCLVADLPKSTMRNLAMSVQPTSQPLASLVSSLP
jgi:anti-sigma factor RsiW